MITRAIHQHRRSLIAALVLAAALAASAAGPLATTAAPAAPAAPGQDEAALGADLVKTGLYLITGGGANSLLRLSPVGSILVDGKLPGAYRELRSQVRRISKLSDLPVRVLIATNHHANHAGNAVLFAAAGVALIVQEKARACLPAMAATPATPAPGAKAPAPTVTFDRAYPLRMGGIEAQVLHFGSASTDSDAVVLFPDLKVIAVGELFTSGPPTPDFAGGGSLVNWGQVLEQVLKLEFDIVVPGTGPVVGRAELIAFKAKLDVLVARGAALVRQGLPRDRLLAQLQTQDLGWSFSFNPEQIDRLYADLSQIR